jgi:hypothetical protein
MAVLAQLVERQYCREVAGSSPADGTNLKLNIMLKDFTTSELEAELNKRRENGEFFKSKEGQFYFHRKENGGYLLVDTTGGISYADILRLDNDYQKPCTRKEFLDALDVAYTKIREALA